MTFESSSDLTQEDNGQSITTRIAEIINEHGPLSGPDLAEKLGMPEQVISKPVWQMLDCGDLRLNWECKLRLRPEVSDATILPD
jgi:hypothetical protein